MTIDSGGYCNHDSGCDDALGSDGTGVQRCDADGRYDSGGEIEGQHLFHSVLAAGMAVRQCVCCNGGTSCNDGKSGCDSSHDVTMVSLSLMVTNAELESTVTVVVVAWCGGSAVARWHVCALAGWRGGVLAR